MLMALSPELILRNALQARTNDSIRLYLSQASKHQLV